MTYPKLFEDLSVRQIQERLNLDVLRLQWTDGGVLIVHSQEQAEVSPGDEALETESRQR